MARGRSTEIIAMIEWIRASRLSIKISLSEQAFTRDNGDVTILDNFYEMELNVVHGSLSLGSSGPFLSRS